MSSTFSDADSRVESRGESLFLPQAKMIIIGDSTVGKSSIIWKYISEDFKLNMPSTIGNIITYIKAFAPNRRNNLFNNFF